MKRYLIALVLLSILGLSMGYQYYSSPSKSDGKVVSFDLVMGSADVKSYLEHIISDQKSTKVVYQRAEAVLKKVDKSDVSIGYIKDVSNLAHMILGHKRYWCNIKLGKSVEIDLVVVLYKNKESNIQNFSLTTKD
ncbi:hypothetical protein GCM10008107_26600 [Psychrosphaera saromensis]|uniref:Uncharacterized protein n=1 Tax=Psychrosphaera saromensis TaxID=716813 RepID=A0A2S7UVF7_9GAMM|nr:hypothetical protein [Psychrosphaera saromensis]PQJ53976.1 hypothetical protein BTO11_10125 [Psychrosphaera saromensis]GHB75858.1 hypothetical protein GCM10008107_26600 [Psychrosphaera saromensis]GLQ14537.1 hypothetical protein GCM10007917_19920 [Psychrosphaera saromensis]